MKKNAFRTIVTLLLLTTCIFSATGQNTPTTTEGWATRLNKFGTSLPQEQIYLHLDNTCYYLGDTIFYKAYVRRTDTGQPTNLSGLLYCELLNQDGYLVERQLVELKNGEGHGDFALLDTLYGGYYELRAYTRWQLNWGITEHPHTKYAADWFYGRKMVQDYYRDYEKLYSRVFPVYDKPQKPGEYYGDMTLRPLRRVSKATDIPPTTVLSFYPEGGNLVAGTRQNIAWEVRNDIGQSLNGTLSIQDISGKTLASSKTINRGRGIATIDVPANGILKGVFTPDTDEKSGNPTGAQTGEKNLPNVVKNGVAMEVKSSTSGFDITCNAVDTASTESLGMTIMRSGVMVDFQNIENGKAIHYTPEKAGTYQVTIFNADGRIYADRLCFYLPTGFNEENITFNGVNEDGYKAFAPIDVTLTGEPGSRLSVSVQDIAHSEYIYDNGTMLTEDLLSSQIRGFVPQPEWFFSKDDEEHRQGLDLLLMVQGWRRYDWHTMTFPDAFTLYHKPEQFSQRLQGQVNRYKTEQVMTAYEAGLAQEIQAFMENDKSAMEEEEEKASMSEEERSQEAMKSGSESPLNEQYYTQERNGNQRERFYENNGNLQRPVLVHAEFTQPGASPVEGDMMTTGNRFFIDTPRFYEGCWMFLGASDSTKWSKGKAPMWVSSGEDSRGNKEFPEFYLKLDLIYPRFVKSYDYYQSHLAPLPKESPLSKLTNDDVRMLSQVNVGARHGRQTKFNPKYPAFVIDAYEAFNATCDAGFCPGYYLGSDRFIWDIARTYIGDMNMERDYYIEKRWNGQNTSSNISDGTKEMYNHLSNLSDVYVYTDYSPRLEGNKKWEGTDQPMVTVDLRLFEDGSVRKYYLNRRWLLKGFSEPDEFYCPDYSNTPLPSTPDFRRTLYWNPNVILDENGSATLHFYNNNSRSIIQIEAEGWNAQGNDMVGKK